MLVVEEAMHIAGNTGRMKGMGMKMKMKFLRRQTQRNRRTEDMPVCQRLHP